MCARLSPGDPSVSHTPPAPMLRRFYGPSVRFTARSDRSFAVDPAALFLALSIIAKRHSNG